MVVRTAACAAMMTLSIFLGLERASAFLPPFSSLARTSAPARTSPSLVMATAETETAQYTLDKKKIGGPLTPIANHILVKVRSKDATSDGGIILPEKAKEKPTEGVVLAMGPGRMHPETGVPVPLPCAEGDKVLYGKYDGTAVDYMGEDHQFVRDQDILFIYSGERMEPGTIKMIRDEVLVKVDPETVTSKSGLMIAKSGDDSGSGPSTGEVVAVGPGRNSDSGEIVPMTVQAGDFIKFRNFAGSEVKMQGVDYRIMKIGEILAKW